MKKKILFAASECVPFIKTGGLADVVGSLPKYFNRDEFDVRIVIPKYLCISEEYRKQMEYINHFYMYYSGRNRYVGILYLNWQGIPVYFIDDEDYFGGGYPYTDYYYDIEKFGFFAKAVLAILPSIDFKADIIHCHDWHTGLIPVYLRTQFAADEYYADMKTIMTIHNLRFQGNYNIDKIKEITGLPDYLFTNDKLEAYGDANYLKGGIVYADRVTTVSPTYKEEIQMPFYGDGLDGLLWARSNVMSGILNGIDYDEWNPATDPLIPVNYSVLNFRQGKKKNKQILQKEMGLDTNPQVMTIGIISRLTDQKGFDLIERVMQEMVDEGVQFVVLGTGEWRYEQLFKRFATEYPHQVAANIFYSNELSHRIYAGCDAFLMPSLFEPCGLSQMMSLRYGTVPIVRETGGLKDSVEPYNKFENTGTGFSFLNYNAHEMLATVRRAKELYEGNRRRWNQMVERGMKKDFSWSASARRYEELYNDLLTPPAPVSGQEKGNTETESGSRESAEAEAGSRESTEAESGSRESAEKETEENSME